MTGLSNKALVFLGSRAGRRLLDLPILTFSEAESTLLDSKTILRSGYWKSGGGYWAESVTSTGISVNHKLYVGGREENAVGRHTTTRQLSMARCHYE